mmetsp:Transcript_35807/g.79693  ORF Transcript_35807/g.79693 Transcript_35807/m.79693 type:complete len:345 (+) Transcript_35807:630-1664(+)
MPAPAPSYCCPVGNSQSPRPSRTRTIECTQWIHHGARRTCKSAARPHYSSVLVCCRSASDRKGTSLNCCTEPVVILKLSTQLGARSPCLTVPRSGRGRRAGVMSSYVRPGYLRLAVTHSKMEVRGSWTPNWPCRQTPSGKRTRTDACVCVTAAPARSFSLCARVVSTSPSSLRFTSRRYSALTSAPVRSKNQSGTCVSGVTGRSTWVWRGTGCAGGCCCCCLAAPVGERVEGSGSLLGAACPAAGAWGSGAGDGASGRGMPCAVITELSSLHPVCTWERPLLSGRNAYPSTAAAAACSPCSPGALSSNMNSKPHASRNSTAPFTDTISSWTFALPSLICRYLGS